MRKILPIKILLLICIIAFGFFLRIISVDKAPSGILVDEASIGYNAYSILKTGKDEWGQKLPLTFKAFGDQKLPAYIYLTVPSVKLFGLNNFAVRLPSVIAGTLLILVVFYFLRSLGFSQNLSLLGSFITAVSPWMIILSRFGYESNVGLLFFTIGLLFLTLGIKRKSYLFYGLSAIFLGLSCYAYIAYRMVTVLFIASFFVYLLFKKYISVRNIVLFSFVFLITISPILSTIFTKSGTARFNQIGIAADQGLPMEINENRAICTQHLPKIICYAYANKAVVYARTILYRYINLFSLPNLFTTGETQLEYLSVEHFGWLPLVLIPFYIIGLLFIFLKNNASTNSFTKSFIIFGLLIAVLPCALAGESQKVRASALFPFLLPLIMYGFAVFNTLVKRKFKIFTYIASSALLVLLTTVFMIQYLTIHVNKFEIAYGTYIEGLMKFMNSKESTQQIYIQPFLSETLMYYAYYNKLDPTIYQKEIKVDNPLPNGFQHAIGLRNIKVTSQSEEYLACKSKSEGKDVIIISNNLIANPDLASSISVYKAQTANKVFTLAYAYDSNKLLSALPTDCTKVLKVK